MACWSRVVSVELWSSPGELGEEMAWMELGGGGGGIRTARRYF